MDYSTQIADEIWLELEPVIRVVADQVQERVPDITVQIIRVPSPHIPLAAYVGFVKPSEVTRDREDVLISIGCFNETSGMRCQSDIDVDRQRDLQDGPVVHVRQGQDAETTNIQIRSWIDKTREFMLRNVEFVARNLKGT